MEKRRFRCASAHPPSHTRIQVVPKESCIASCPMSPYPSRHGRPISNCQRMHNHGNGRHNQRICAVIVRLAQYQSNGIVRSVPVHHKLRKRHSVRSPGTRIGHQRRQIRRRKRFTCLKNHRHPSRCRSHPNSKHCGHWQPPRLLGQCGVSGLSLPFEVVILLWEPNRSDLRHSGPTGEGRAPAESRVGGIVSSRGTKIGSPASAGGRGTK